MGVFINISLKSFFSKGQSKRKRASQGLIHILTVAALGMGLLHFLAPLIDISDYQKDLSSLISENLQRKFELGDKVFIKLSFKPTVVTDKLAVANPDWCKTRYLLKAEQAELGVDLLDLVLGKITIDRLILKQASLNLEQTDGRNNWSFGKADKVVGDKAPKGSPVRLDYAVLDDVKIDYYFPTRHKQLYIKHAVLKKSLRQRYKFDFDGMLDSQNLHVQISSNRWFDIQDIRPLNLKIEASLGINHLTVSAAIPQIAPRLQADIQLQSQYLDVDNLLKLFAVGKQVDKKTGGLTSLDPWLGKINQISIGLSIDNLLYQQYEVKGLSLQNDIVVNDAQKNALFSLNSSGKAEKIMHNKTGESALLPSINIAQSGQASFSITGKGNTLVQLLSDSDIKLQAENLSGEYFKPYFIKHLKVATDGEKRMHVDGAMRYNHAPVDFDVRSGKTFVEGLLGDGMVELDMLLNTGKSKLVVDASGRNLLKPGSRKINLQLDGNHLVAWEPVFGKKLYKLEHFKIESRLEMQRKGIKVSRFNVTTPDSYLTGKLFYRYGKRATVNVLLENSRLRWADLNKQAPSPATDKPSAQTKGKQNVMLIPSTDLLALLSPAFDVNLEMKSTEMVFTKFAVKDMQLKARWQDKVLATQIEKGQVADGVLTADIYLTIVDNEAAGKIEMNVKQLDYGKLMQEMGLGDKMKGTADLNIHLVGFGKDFKQFLTHSDGTVEFVGEKGILASKYLRLWGEDIVQQILPFNWFGKEQTGLNCVVGRFDLTDGRLSSDSLLLDTENMTIAGTGAISLATEVMEFELMPDPKNISLISLATPVKIRGTLAKPKIVPHTLGTSWTIGSLLVGLANPAILIARFAKLGSLGENPCLAAIGIKEGEEEETSVLKAFKDAVKFIQRPFDKLPDIE